MSGVPPSNFRLVATARPRWGPRGKPAGSFPLTRHNFAERAGRPGRGNNLWPAASFMPMMRECKVWNETG